MIRKRKVGVILILIGIGIAFLFSQLTDKDGDVYIDLGEYSYLEFPYGYPLSFGVIFVLSTLFVIGLALCAQNIM